MMYIVFLELTEIAMNCWRNSFKLMPTIVLLGLAVLAGATDLFGSGVHQALHLAFVTYVRKTLPFAIDLLLAAVVINIAWLLYKPFCTGFERTLSKSGASKRGQDLSLKLLKFFYWAAVVLLVLSMTAAEILGRFVIGFGVFGAALTLSLQGVANDFICGLLIQFCRKVQDGDQIKVEGIDVEGTVTNVDYLSTTVESKTANVRVPNREVWARAINVLKPQPSPIILPQSLARGK